MKRYQIITYDHYCNGADEKQEYKTIKEAIKVAKEYLKDYESVFIYDYKTNSVRHSFNSIPSHSIFAADVDINSCIIHL